MSVSRDAILARLRGAKANVLPMESIVYQPYVSSEQALKRQRFIDALTASHAEIISIKQNELHSAIENTITSKQLKRVVLGTAGEFHAQIVQATQQIETTLFDTDIKDWKTEMFNDIDAGMTHCHAGIADTGTLVLWPDTTEPRTLSLIPPCHIALIKQSTINSNFSELMVSQAWQNNMPTNIVLVSGPSKTADIQQTLAYGAHGPSQLVVILIEDM